MTGLDECPRSAELMQADIHFAAAMARAHRLNAGGKSAIGRVDPRRPADGPPTDSRRAGGHVAGQPAPGMAHLSPSSPAAGHRAYTLTTKGWIAVLCAEAEPFVWPDQAP